MLQASRRRRRRRPNRSVSPWPRQPALPTPAHPSTPAADLARRPGAAAGARGGCCCAARDLAVWLLPRGRRGAAAGAGCTGLPGWRDGRQGEAGHACAAQGARGVQGAWRAVWARRDCRQRRLPRKELPAARGAGAGDCGSLSTFPATRLPHRRVTWAPPAGPHGRRCSVCGSQCGGRSVCAAVQHAGERPPHRVCKRHCRPAALQRHPRLPSGPPGRAGAGEAAPGRRRRGLAVTGPLAGPQPYRGLRSTGAALRHFALLTGLQGHWPPRVASACCCRSACRACQPTKAMRASGSMPAPAGGCPSTPRTCHRPAPGEPGGGVLQRPAACGGDRQLSVITAGRFTPSATSPAGQHLTGPFFKRGFLSAPDAGCGDVGRPLKLPHLLGRQRAGGNACALAGWVQRCGCCKERWCCRTSACPHASACDSQPAWPLARICPHPIPAVVLLCLLPVFLCVRISRRRPVLAEQAARRGPRLAVLELSRERRPVQPIQLCGGRQ